MSAQTKRPLRQGDGATNSKATAALMFVQTLPSVLGLAPEGSKFRRPQTSQATSPRAAGPPAASRLSRSYCRKRLGRQANVDESVPA